jgi:hypothetical protein
MVALVVHQPDRVEDLHGVMGVEARDDLRERAEVAVDELAQPAAVVHGARARPPGDEELEAGDAEGVLDVDGKEADADRVLSCRPEPVLLGPGSGLVGALLVADAPDLADAVRVEVRRNRELAHGPAECSAPQWPR